ncbi:MAG: dehydrogenase [Cereibacter sphaeroides]|uniref:Dehydrogenase n=1 Tax=Cereibacter sphaeroides TaxID=1063 RepID=A0A2W5S202_CERSP|nr:MAG: dehydrogenase [Cereibacter sphaeroides]
MAKVFSTHHLHPDVTTRLKAAGDYLVASSPTGAAFLAEGTDADVIIVRAPVPPVYFARTKNLRAAVRHGAGLDMIPMEAATAAGVVVANVPAVNAVTVAEHAIFAALALARRFRSVDATLRSQGWAAARLLADDAHDLSGRTLGILGFGNIGRWLHRMGSAFGMKVIATTRRPDSLPADVTPVTLDDLAARSDVLVIACPLTEETRGAINTARLALMRPHTLLINVARGPIIDTPALVQALREKRIGGAALDVFDTQPLPADSPLFGFPNVILTPHVAGITEDSMLRMGEGTADEVLRILANDLPVNFCNPEVEAHYRKRFPA